MRYCLLCGNRDKSVSYFTFPKNEDSCRKWLDFCGIDKQVLTTSTKLCSDHFQKEDIINKSKGTMAKPNAVPSIISKKKKLRQSSNLNICKDRNLEELKDTGWYNEADDKSLNIVDVKNLNICKDHNLEELKDTGWYNEADHKSLDIVNIKNLNICKDRNLEELKDTGWYNEADDKSLNIVDVKTAESFEFVSVDEDSMEFKEERPSTPPSFENNPCFRRPVKTIHFPRYVGDITMSHLDTPVKADIALQVAKRTIAKQRRKIKTLQQSRNRLAARVTRLKELVNNLKQQKKIV